LTTYTPFQPPLNAPFSFQPTLDGQQYLCQVKWGLAGQRWYVQCTQLDGTPVFYLPLLGSEVGVAIQNVAWNRGVVTLTTDQPHGYALADTINLTISRATAAALNGVWECLITGDDTLTFALANDPGASAMLGVLSYDINMAAGYFQTSTLVFRQPNQSFEVTP
jgi:hypothetical protein